MVGDGVWILDGVVLVGRGRGILVGAAAALGLEGWWCSGIFRGPSRGCQKYFDDGRDRTARPSPTQHDTTTAMAPTLTKRKRVAIESSRKIRVVEKPAADVESEDDGQEMLDAQEIFRRHFEAQFKPLPEAKVKAKKVAVVEELEEEDEEEGGEDWSGLSGEEEEEEDEDDEDDEDEGPTVDIVEHTTTIARPKMSKADMKAFMVHTHNTPPPGNPS